MVINAVFLWLSLCCTVTTLADTKTIDINIPNYVWDGVSSNIYIPLLSYAFVCFSEWAAVVKKGT